MRQGKVLAPLQGVSIGNLGDVFAPADPGELVPGAPSQPEGWKFPNVLGTLGWGTEMTHLAWLYYRLI